MMRDTISGEELLGKASAIGQYYGFIPLASLTAKKRGQRAKIAYPETLATQALDPVAETVAGFLKRFHQVESIPSARQPLFVWHTNLPAGRQAP